MPKFNFKQIEEAIPELGTIELIRLKLLVEKEGKKRVKIIENE